MSPEKKPLLLRLIRVAVLAIVCLAALAGGVGVSAYFLTNKPQPKRRQPEPTAPLVAVQEVHSGRHQVVVSVTGTVIPAVEVRVQPQVTGKIVELHPEFIEGGLVRQGDVLTRLESCDYELAVTTQEAQVESARNDLQSEQGQQDVARHEWDLLDMKEEASPLDKELALRQPQLRQAQAALRAAEAQLDQARLDLARTVIKAPCNAIIQSADVEVGDLATTQTSLATLVGTDAYWIRVSVPVDELPWIVLPGAQDGPASGTRVLTGTGALLQGQVVSLLGDLEPEGTLARLLIEVPDPLGLTQGKRQAPLLLGEYVHVEILGRAIENVVEVPREALRDGDRLWLVTGENTLDIATVETVWADAARAFVRGLANGDRIILSDVATPVDGMPIRLPGGAGTGGGDIPSPDEKEMGQ